MKTEKAIWAHLKKETDKDVHWTRIEAWAGSGIPDLNGAFLWPSLLQETPVEIWCELKVCSTIKFQGVGLWRPAQIAWQTKRSRVSRNVYNLISHPRAEVVRIYDAGQVAEVHCQSTESPEPLLILPIGAGMWSAFLELAASRSKESPE